MSMTLLQVSNRQRIHLGCFPGSQSFSHLRSVYNYFFLLLFPIEQSSRFIIYILIQDVQWNVCVTCSVFLCFKYKKIKYNISLWCDSILSSLADARPHLNLHWEEVWEPHINFLVFEVWFTIARSRLLGAPNVYHMSLYMAHSQLYQIIPDNVCRATEIRWGRRRWVCRIDVVIVLPSLPVLWLVPYLRRKSDPWNPGCLAVPNEIACKAAWIYPG